jgi:hypothetical protein
LRRTDREELSGREAVFEVRRGFGCPGRTPKFVAEDREAGDPEESVEIVGTVVEVVVAEHRAVEPGSQFSSSSTEQRPFESVPSGVPWYQVARIEEERVGVARALVVDRRAQLLNTAGEFRGARLRTGVFDRPQRAVDVVRVEDHHLPDGGCRGRAGILCDGRGRDRRTRRTKALGRMAGF